MKILITGGAGYIGSHTLVEALRAGHEVLVLDNFETSGPESLRAVKQMTNRDFGFVEADIRDRRKLLNICAAFRPEAVIHFAGLKAVGESNTIPARYYGVNVGGSVNLLEAMEACGCKRFVFSSSATVYGDPRYLPIDEAHPLSTTNPYGRSKLQVEDILRDQARAHAGWSIAILRYFNPVGAHESGLIGESPTGVPNNLMPYVAQVATGERPELSVFGNDYDTPDGTGVRDYIHVVDLARAHIAAIDWSGRQTGARSFNLGVGRGSSVLEMVAAFEEVSGRPVPYRIAPRRAGDIGTCFADATRAEVELGWRAEKDISDMCRSAWDWAQKTASGKVENPSRMAR